MNVDVVFDASMQEIAIEKNFERTMDMKLHSVKIQSFAVLFLSFQPPHLFFKILLSVGWWEKCGRRNVARGRFKGCACSSKLWGLCKVSFFLWRSTV